MLVSCRAAIGPAFSAAAIIRQVGAPCKPYCGDAAPCGNSADRGGVAAGMFTPLAFLLFAAAAPVLVDDVPLPRERPTESVAPKIKAVDSGEAGAEGDDAAEAAEPTSEPERIYQAQCPAVVAGLVEAQLLPPIAEEGCVEQTPWSVTAVRVGDRSIPLSTPATLSCEMAQSLPGWAEAVNGYLEAREDTELATIVVGTSYLCRDTVGGSTDRTSEHGFANALDVVGFSLADGRSVAVETGWPDADSAEGRLLRFSHDAACSMFSTTLGPEANADHHDHFHLDMGCHGGSCTARLCD
jgi:hypothetical protein